MSKQKLISVFFMLLIIVCLYHLISKQDTTQQNPKYTTSGGYLSWYGCDRNPNKSGQKCKVYQVKMPGKPEPTTYTDDIFIIKATTPGNYYVQYKK